MIKKVRNIKEMIELYKGDCLELMKNIPDKSIDMILCDLPYGTTGNTWDTIIPFEPLWKHYNRIIKDCGTIVLFAQPPFDKVLGNSNIKLLKYEYIWVKNKATGHMNSKKMPLKKHENILVFYKNTPTYNPQGIRLKPIPTVRKGRTGNGTNYGLSDKDSSTYYENYPDDILVFNRVLKTLHPTQKPVELLEYLIKTYTNENETVLDNCMGSGSTGVSCVKTNRNFIGIELDENYFNIANERIKDAQKEMKRRLF